MKKDRWTAARPPSVQVDLGFGGKPELGYSVMLISLQCSNVPNRQTDWKQKAHFGWFRIPTNTSLVPVYLLVFFINLAKSSGRGPPVAFDLGGDATGGASAELDLALDEAVDFAAFGIFILFG